jgi:ABC-type transport system involved in cytochrome c biogenesis permease subunit
LARRENQAFWLEQFLQRKSQSTQSAKRIVALVNHIKEASMEYLILAAVVSMMALYALIIVGCLKQPEW